MGCNYSIHRNTSIENVQLELRHKNINDIILTLGIDYTKSNKFNGNMILQHNLHHIGDQLNPYQQVLSLVTRTLEPLISLNSIYMFGFSDVYSQNRTVFPLYYRNSHILNKLENSGLSLSNQVLDVYKLTTPKVTLCNPSTLIPLIETSINISKIKKKPQVLVIITDSDLVNYIEEVNKILETLLYPISIICIGVGIGPFKILEEINQANFAFVNFNKIQQIQNEGKQSRKIFENLPKMFNRLKSLDKIDGIDTELSTLKPIQQYFIKI